MPTEPVAPAPECVRRSDGFPGAAAWLYPDLDGSVRRIDGHAWRMRRGIGGAMNGVGLPKKNLDQNCLPAMLAIYVR